MDFVSGGSLVGIAFVLAVLFFFGSAVSRLNRHPQQATHPAECTLTIRTMS
jgi:hypothetical protein